MAIIQKKKRKACPVRCGDCRHYKTTKKSGYEDVCKNMGVIKSQKAPECFSADLHAFRKFREIDSVEKIGELVKDYTPKQSRLLAQFLLNQQRFSSLNVHFGQCVYVCLGSDYLNHYYKGYVMDVDETNGYVCLISQLKASKLNTVLTFPLDSILSFEEFIEKARDLVIAGKIEKAPLESDYRNRDLADKIDDEGYVNVGLLIRLEEDLTVPTIDQAPAPEKKKRRAKTKTKGVDDIYRDAASGLIMRKLS